ncbi:MAG: helix-turn-helix domain-containing protein [Propionibacteriaceae bacterium]|nr:helix-turn-helix domain-containing protein [Propionibacteriaceae bacterium]
MSLHQVSVILLEPVAMFEFSLAVEVFGVDRSDDGIEPFDFRVCAVEPGKPMASKNFDPFTITAQLGLEAVAGSDLVVVAATLPRADDEYPAAVLEALRAAHRAGATVLSLCSASFVLGAAGLLDGRRCTTHWLYADQMRRRYPQADVDAKVLFVEDTGIVTSAGTAAGIDACLHLVRKELGAAVATRIARRMVVPPQRDGGQLQYVEAPIPACSADSLSPVLEWAVANLDQAQTVATLAARAVMSERTFARRFASETGTTPHKWLNQQRILAARNLLERTDLSVDQISSRVGFNSPVVLREHFREVIGISPLAYRRRFGNDPDGEDAELAAIG